MMGVLPLLEKNSKPQACLENQNLPANYMADYSVMGLVVDRLDQALAMLKEKKFDVRKHADGFEITIDGAKRISELVSLLQKDSIDCAITDIVDQVYQG